MTRRGAAGIAGALVALVLFAVAATALDWSVPGTGGPSEGGPMRPAPEHGMVAEGKLGTTFTDGFEILQLEGDQPATIVSVKSVGGSETFRPLGALLAGPDRKLAAVNFIEGYPPTSPRLGSLVPAGGAVLEPSGDTRDRMGYELLVGYEIVSDTEVGYRAGIDVTYRVRDDTFVWRSPARLLYCPESMNSRQCHNTAEAHNWGE